MNRYAGPVLALAAACSAASARAADGQWTFATGVDYTRGDYGEAQDTTIVTVPFQASFGTDRWSVSLIVPLVSVDGPGTIVPSGLGDGGPVGGLLGGASAASPIAPPGGVDEMGLGDVSLALSAVPVKTDDGMQLTITGRVKAPTADADRRLGTGEAAASIAGALRQMVGERAALFGSVGYEQAFDGASGVFADIGAEGYVAERVLLGTTIDFSQASSQLRRDSAQASAYVGIDVSPKTRILAYGSAGLTETSPDVGAGLRVVFTAD